VRWTLRERPEDEVAAINLKETLASGQTFAFIPWEGGFAGVADGRPVWVKDMESAISSEEAESGSVGFCPIGRGETRAAAADVRLGARMAVNPGSGGEIPGAGLWIRRREEDAGFWRRYFDLDRDYSEILARYAAEDPYLDAQVRAYAGLRILRQPVWEALCAFIISANNHQRRIESIYRNISARYGSRIRWDELGMDEGIPLYGFPSPEALAGAGEEALRRTGAGYRAGYLAAAARMIAEGFSLDLDGMDYETALRHLTQLPGVGEKVADCVLVFATRHSCAFPVDVWIERVLRDVYGMCGSRKAIKREAQARFGEWAGVVQQYLFHGARNARQRYPKPQILRR
jgi:N-glycosylase/DNA lyase